MNDWIGLSIFIGVIGAIIAFSAPLIATAFMKNENNNDYASPF
jgi:hypothetical protein